MFQNSFLDSIPPVVKNLIIINIICLIAAYSLSSMGIDLRSLMAIYHFDSPHFRPYQFVTHLFMHGDIWHLVFNMFALWMFGRSLEYAWGSKRFFLYYTVTGLGAAALHLLVSAFEMHGVQEMATAIYHSPTPELFKTFIEKYISSPNPKIFDFITEWSSQAQNAEYANTAKMLTRQVVDMKMNVPTVGASGAVYGVLLAFGMLFPNVELMLMFPPIPIKAKYMVMGYGAIELYLGIANYSGDNIAHFAHLGGMIFGFILIKYWEKTTRRE